MSQFVAIRGLKRQGGSIRVPSVLQAPTSPAAAAVGSGGTFAAGTYYWKIVAVDASGGVSVPSAQVNAAIVLNGSANLSWTAAPGAVSYQVWRGTSSNGQDHYQTTTSTSFTDTGAVGTAGTIPTVATGSVLTSLTPTVDLVVDLDNVTVRRELAHHSAIGQWIVVATNNSYGAAGSKVNLPANS